MRQNLISSDEKNDNIFSAGCEMRGSGIPSQREGLSAVKKKKGIED